MKRRAYIERHAAPRPEFLCLFRGRRKTGRLPGQNNLTGRVVIGDIGLPEISSVGYGFFHPRLIESEDCGHAAHALRHRLLHKAGAVFHQKKRLFIGKGTGCHERRVFAETQPGRVRGTDPRLLQKAGNRYTYAQHR